jgi:hypothetical protein
MKWDIILGELVQAISTDDAEGKIKQGILYLVISFGVLELFLR